MPPIRNPCLSNIQPRQKQPILVSHTGRSPAGSSASPRLGNPQRQPSSNGAQPVWQPAAALPSPSPSEESIKGLATKNARPSSQSQVQSRGDPQNPSTRSMNTTSTANPHAQMLLSSPSLLRHLNALCSSIKDIPFWRIRMLEDSCLLSRQASSSSPLIQVVDLPFLLTHQILCLAGTDPSQLPNQIWLIPNVNSAFELLTIVLRGSPGTDQRWAEYSASFATFPATPAAVRDSPEYMVAISHAHEFLFNFSTRIAAFEDTCVRNKAPPMAQYIQTVFQTSSLHLQTLVFELVIRKITNNPDERNWAFNMFLNSQLDMLGRQSAALPRMGLELTQQAQAPGQGETRPTNSGPAQSLRQQPGRLQSSNHHVNQQTVPQRTSGFFTIPAPSPQTDHQRRASLSIANQISPLNNNNPFRSPSNMGTGSIPGPNSHPGSTSAHTAQLPVNALGRTQVLSGPKAPDAQLQSRLQPHSQAQKAAPPPRFKKQGDFFPAPHIFAAQIVPADPTRCALHQAHLVSPKLICSDNQPGGPSREQRAYQYTSNLALPPQEITQKSILCKWTFNMTADDVAKLAKDFEGSVVQRRERVVDSQTTTYRIRCVKGSPADFSDQSAWVTADCTWPAHVFFQINSHRLEVRRKVGHGRDLPCDVTPYIVEGENVLEAFANMNRDGPRLSFAVAVEAIHLSMHAAIEADVRRRVFTAEQTKAAISSWLSSNDDEVAFSALRVGLFDPIMASRIFDIPVRGPSCRHRECFDLENFLQTRTLKAAGEPSKVDVWRCPICKGDARPNVLLVDEWMQLIRAELAARGKLETRFVEVQADASWKAVDEKENPPSRRRAEGQRKKQGPGKCDAIDIHSD